MHLNLAIPKTISAIKLKISLQPDIYYILTNRYLTVADVCGVILQNTEGCMDVNTTMTDWTIDIDPTKPEIIDPELLPVNIIL
jgi:hypothetical protein